MYILSNLWYTIHVPTFFYFGRRFTLYTQNDYDKINQQIKKRLFLFLIPVLILTGLVVYSFILRIKWLTMGLTILLGAMIIFVHGMYIGPLTSYKKHLSNALMGRTRTTTGAFKEMDEKEVVREGVRYFPMLITVGDISSPEDDRLFYYDASLPRPSFKVGEMMTITSHDKYVANYAII